VEAPIQEDKKLKSKELKPAPRKKHSEADSRFQAFVAAIHSYWKNQNTILLTWNDSEGKNLKELLAANPALTVEQFAECLANRAASEGVVHSERPRTWLCTVLKYANGPLDRYGRQKTAKPKGDVPMSASEIARRQQTGEKWR